MERYVQLPLSEDIAVSLTAGDMVYLTGEMLVARDAAHARIVESLEKGEGLMFDLENAVIYYMGPSPGRDGRPLGSAGPTTAGRMDRYTPMLLDKGLRAMIGKGNRNAEVIEAIVRNKAVYFVAIGGAGALLSKCIETAELVCYRDLGTEAVRRITVKDFPVIVAIDSRGKNLYEIVQGKSQGSAR